ncbi:MAG: ATP-binding protein [Bacteroidota bacterium]
MVITAIILLFVFGFRQMNLLLVNGSYLLAIMVLCFATSYFVILFFLEKFIYRKIKLIYKTIHRSKLSKKEKIDLNSDIIDEVEKEVVDWATDQQKEIDALKSLENYRREFLGNISHELKTPIFNIQGYLLTLLDGGLYDKKINESYLNRAAKNVERLQTIVEDLDSISKLESGRLVLEMQDFGIRQLTDEVFEDLEMLANEKNINLTFKEGAAVDFRVKADRESIRQVMTNLVTNSVKYGKENGYTKVSFYDMDKYILIEVADDGIGISKEHLNHVFDRFYRVDKSRSRQQGGSGLGLSIVKHIIEAHQQTINVRSVQGLGSTFGFTLAKA